VSIDSSINLRNDVIFKAIFGYEKNEKLLISLLNAILGLTGNKKIVSLTFLNAFNIKEYLKDKLTILDVKAVDGTGVRFDVEMQVAPDKSYLQRIMYYLDRLFTEQLKEGVPYEKLCKAISISILDFIFFEEEGDLHNIYRFLNIKSKRELTDLKELQFIELPKFKKDKPKRDMSKFEKWLLALKFGEIYANDLENLPEELKEEEEIVMALHELVRASNDDMIREILEMRSKARHDEASRLYQAEMKGKEDVAKNLLEMDMPIEKIAKATGISVEEIEKLK
jgi:predicted transposase/invertase (TIGR01784 family)